MKKKRRSRERGVEGIHADARGRAKLVLEVKVRLRLRWKQLDGWSESLTRGVCVEIGITFGLAQRSGCGGVQTSWSDSRNRVMKLDESSYRFGLHNGRRVQVTQAMNAVTKRAE